MHILLCDVHVYVYIYVCVCVRVHIYTYIHRHTHTHIVYMYNIHIYIYIHICVCVIHTYGVILAQSGDDPPEAQKALARHHGWDRRQWFGQVEDFRTFGSAVHWSQGDPVVFLFLPFWKPKTATDHDRDRSQVKTSCAASIVRHLNLNYTSNGSCCHCCPSTAAAMATVPGVFLHYLCVYLCRRADPRRAEKLCPKKTYTTIYYIKKRSMYLYSFTVCVSLQNIR